MIRARLHLVLVKVWEEHRNSFSEEEKTILNEEVCGASICPQGIFVRLTEKTRPVLDKLLKLSAPTVY